MNWRLQYCIELLIAICILIIPYFNITSLNNELFTLICLSVLITVFMSKVYRRTIQSDVISKKIEEETETILKKVTNGFS